ncbi:MAG: DNA mismatch repair protein MutL, partial [Microcoleus sp. SM1_3_4]|nr:DNA mismatch repair protein MutL [Microcoleus sp. SM1_3_4]
MASTIQVLPTEVVNLIAAGEVIDSFAAVVRELVENSLDAGATRIVVSLWPQRWCVSVADNGCGMTLSDLQQAATPHSTSKIRTCNDLWKIRSLGFRGEALHSLTTLADLEIWSRFSLSSGEEIRHYYDSSSSGWRILYNRGGEPIQVEAAAVAPGTVVSVSNLFDNWVARRQRLPSVALQMKAVQAMIYNIALCHPKVTWLSLQNDRAWFSLSPSTSTAQILAQIIPQVRPTDLEELELILDIPDSKLHLVVGLPDRCHR